jgi:acetyl-CoA synthetase
MPCYYASRGFYPNQAWELHSPYPGIEPVIIDPISGAELQGSNAEEILAIKHPWPSMARTVWRDHDRYMETYFNIYSGYYVCVERLLHCSRPS